MDLAAIRVLFVSCKGGISHHTGTRLKSLHLYSDIPAFSKIVGPRDGVVRPCATPAKSSRRGSRQYARNPRNLPLSIDTRDPK